MNQQYHYIDRVEPPLCGSVHALFQQAWWTAGRSPESVPALLAGSQVTAGVICQDQLVGFARALTDWQQKAVVMDVIVDAGHRRHGVARLLLDRMLSGPLAGVPDVELYCHPDLERFYADLGFARPGPTIFMRRSTASA